VILHGRGVVFLCAYILKTVRYDESYFSVSTLLCNTAADFRKRVCTVCLCTLFKSFFIKVKV